MTPKQERFVEEYLIDLNAAAAYVRAGYAAKGNAAESAASRLLRNVHIAEAIRAAQSERSERTQVDADWVLRRLAAEAEADLADLYDDNGNLLPVKQWPLIWRQGLVAGVETVREKGEDGEASSVDKIKISDRVKRIELLGKHIDVQAFKDRVAVDATADLIAAIQAGNKRVMDGNGS